MAKELYLSKISAKINAIKEKTTNCKESIGSIDSVVARGNLIVDIKADIDNSLKEIYQLMNYSVISGEYVVNSCSEETIDACIEHIETIVIDEGQDRKTKKQEIQDLSDLLLNICKYLTKDLQQYKTRVHVFHKSIKSPESQYLDIDLSNDNSDERNNDLHIKLLSSVFRKNLDLLELDRGFVMTGLFLTKLNKLRRELSEQQKDLDEPYIDILTDKCTLLIFKFSFKEDDNYQLHSLYNYYKNQDEVIDFTPTYVLLTENSTLIKRISKINSRNQSDCKSEITKLYNSLKQNKEDTTFFNFYIECHYYKNVVENVDLLDDLIRRFQEYKETLNNTFDSSNALDSLNYLYNCKLSLLLKQRETSSTIVWAEYYKIKTVQEQTNVHNYFPFLKIAEWYSVYINKNIENIDELSELKKVIRELEICIDQAEKYLQSSKYNSGCFIPFKPNFIDCVDQIKIDADQTVDMFINTSYIIPFDYEREDKRLTKLKAELIEHKSLIKAHQHIGDITAKLEASNKSINNKIDVLEKNTAKKIDDQNNSVQFELKDHQKNNIQILAIFAGIVVFASGTIQIFKGATNIREAVIFMLAFACALGIISSTIWLIFGNKTKLIQIKTAIVIVALLVMLGLNACAIFCDWGNNSVEEESAMSKISHNDTEISRN